MTSAFSNGEIFAGRMPVLDRKGQLFGHSLYFRSVPTDGSCESCGPDQNAAALAGLVTGFGLKKLLGDKPGFISLDGNSVTCGFIRNLPKEALIFEIPVEDWKDEDLRREAAVLRQEGYHFCAPAQGLENLSGDVRNGLFESVGNVRVNTKGKSVPELEKIAQVFSGRGVRLLADGVDTEEAFGRLKNAGYDFFQGLFFASPPPIKTRRLEPRQAAVANLIRLIQANTDIQEIEEEFKKVPELTVALLKFINSASIFTRSRITSIRQTIALIGYAKLLQWLLLLAYASPSGDRRSNPLFRLAAQRAKAMEILSPLTRLGGETLHPDEAFFIGLLSLLDVLFMAPIEDVLAEMNASEGVQAAILRGEGIAGALLELVRRTERNDFDGLKALLDKLGMGLTEVQTALISSFWWVECLNENE
jgi:EAL and modified HD-GYP domain-containing signal transduction protein